MGKVYGIALFFSYKIFKEGSKLCNLENGKYKVWHKYAKWKVESGQCQDVLWILKYKSLSILTLNSFW